VALGTSVTLGHSLLASSGADTGEALLSLALLQAGMIFSVATILNFALGASLSVSLGTPMLMALYAREAAFQWRYTLAGLSVAMTGCILYYLHDLEVILAITNAPAQYVLHLVVLPVSLQTVQSLLL
jgi:hypothetical protein